MGKRLLIFPLAFALGGMLWAFADEPSVSVVDKQESKTSVAKSEVSRINLGIGTVEIVKKNGDKLEFNRESISKILLADSSLGRVDEVSESSLEVAPCITDDIVRISGVSGETAYYLFDINGALKLSGVCNIDTELSLGSFQSGFYLLVVGDETFKLLKK